MTDKIGTLGKASTLTQGTTTVYTCPVGKAARGKLMYRATSGVSSVLALTVNGCKVLQSAAMTTGHFMFSSLAAMQENTGTTEPLGDADGTIVAPGPAEYFLSAGETITYTVTTADLLAGFFAFVGVEVDV